MHAQIPLVFLFTAGLLTSAPTAQANWQRFGNFGPSPTGRYAHGFAYDGHRHRTVLFGGYGLGGGYLGDTWEFDGSNWVQITPPGAPSARFAAPMVYDQGRRRMVLFGGGNSFGFSNETWEYDGTTWTLRTPTHRPSARDGNAFCYDTNRRRAVWFGGWDGQRLGDTWEWDGSDWTQVLTAHAPSPRSDVQLTFDARRGVTVLYGGYDNRGAFADTWEYDGSDWQQRSPTGNPGLLADAALVFDRGRGTVVLFGGAPTQFAQRSGDTWEYDGAQWTLLTPSLANAPSARWVAGMVYDEARGRTVLFGGMDNFAQFPGDTWELVTPQVATWRMFGQGCPGSAGTPTLTLRANDLPRLGGTLGVRLINLPNSPTAVPFLWLGASNTTWASLGLPFDLSGAGMPQCRIQVSLDFGFVLANQGGTATAGFGVPNQTSLLGAGLYAQGTVYDPSANAGGLTWSDAGEARLGH